MNANPIDLYVYRATINIETLQTRFHAKRRRAKLDVTTDADLEGNSAVP